MGIAVVLGNSIKHKEVLKREFNFIFNWDHKVWFKLVNDETYSPLEQIIESKCDGCRVYWIASLDHVRQVQNEDKNIYLEERKASGKNEETIESEYTGKVLEVSKWYANAFKENNNAAYAFRNLKVLNVYRETMKAIQVDAEFFGGISCRCGVCGRQLDNAISQATGIGPVCAEKLGLGRPSLESAQEFVKKLQDMSKAQGVFNKVWIPKSQIREVVNG